VRTERQTQLLDITATVRQALERQSGHAVVLFVPHTTAGIVLQASGEGAAAVAADIEAALQRLVDEGWDWQHAPRTPARRRQADRRRVAGRPNGKLRVRAS
jgi:thiamine phosphate synthase YjbQ (UPF0047 family)